VSAAAVIAAGGLTLIRTAAGGHRIELRDGGALVACLESIEPGDDAPADLANWPASPPVQEWHDEARNGLTVLMAVGRAGRSHWSLSCEITAEGRATFDVAARISELPERLASSYQLSSVDMGLSTPDGVPLGSGWKLIADPATTQLHLDQATGVLSIEPITPVATQFPQTLRWGYTLCKREFGETKEH
jgi:hypothetical protein